MTERIKKIQNKAKSLMWGAHRHSETETMFAVGHKSYGVTKYFMVSDDFVICVCESGKFKTEKFCESEDEVIKEILRLLKLWFPAR